MKHVSELKQWLADLHCAGCYKRNVCKLEPRRNCEFKQRKRKQGIVQVGHGS